MRAFVRRAVLPLALATALGLGALTACTGSEEPPASTTAGAAGAALPAGVTADLVQLRSDVAARQAQVEFRNDTDQPLRVAAVRVDDPRFDGSATRVLDRTSTIAPGRVVDIRIQFPAMRCPAPDDGVSTLSVQYELGGTRGEATVPLAERFPVLADMHARECVAAGLAEAARVSFAEFTPSPSGTPADLALELVPTGEGGAARLEAIYETNLLSFEDPDAVAVSYPLALDITGSAQAPSVLHLPLVPARCDPHAVQEDKRGTVFDIAVVVGGSPGQIQLAAPEEMRARILAWVSAWCATP